MLKPKTKMLPLLRILFIVFLFCNQRFNNKIIEKLNFLIMRTII